MRERLDLNHLFVINDEQYKKMAEHEFANIMAYDPGNSIRRSILKKELGGDY